MQLYGLLPRTHSAPCELCCQGSSIIAIQFSCKVKYNPSSGLKVNASQYFFCVRYPHAGAVNGVFFAVSAALGVLVARRFLRIAKNNAANFVQFANRWPAARREQAPALPNVRGGTFCLRWARLSENLGRSRAAEDCRPYKVFYAA